MSEKENAAPTGDTAVPDAVKNSADNSAVPSGDNASSVQPTPAKDGADEEPEKSSLEADPEEGSGDNAEVDADGGIKGALEEDDDSGEQKDGDGEEASGEKDPDDVELYNLNFEDSDPDGIKTLSKIGKEFGIPTEKAQELADAATKYGASLLQKQQDRTKSNYRDFRAGLKSELKESWGDNYSANIKEARKGAAILVRKYGFPKDFDKQDQYAHLSDDVHFLNVLRDLHRFNSETPHIQGDARSMGGGDVYDDLTSALGGE